MPRCSWRNLWALVLLAAFVNVGGAMVRVVRHRLPQTMVAPSPYADWAADRLLERLPPRSLVVLVLPGLAAPETRLRARAFEWRLRYLTYPMRFRLTERLGEGDWRKADALVGLDAPTGRGPAWTIAAFGPAFIAFPPTASDFIAGRTSREITLVGMARMVLGLGALWLLGSLLTNALGLHGRCWAFRAAAGHLLGATGMCVVTTATYLLTSRLTAWPTYVCLAGLAAWMRLRPSRDAPRDAPPVGPSVTEPRSPDVFMWVAGALIVLGVAAAAATLVTRGALWDGWVIWQLKARAFHHDGDMRILRDAAYAVSHPEYPILVPLHTWWLYEHIGTSAEKVAQVGGLLFYLDLLGLMYGLARLALSSVGGIVACALAAAQPLAIVHAVSGYADVPFAAMMLGAVGCLTAKRPVAVSWRVGLAAGAFLGGAMLCKSEGGLLLVVVAAIATARYVSSVFRSGKWADETRRLAVEASIACVVAVALSSPWFMLRSRYGAVSDLATGRYAVVDALGPTDSGAPPRGTPRRAALIAGTMLRQAAHVGPWMPAWGLVWLLPMLALIRGSWRRQPAGLILGVLILQGMAYAAAYMLTPHPVRWHLSTSLDRLMLHLAPLALLTGIAGVPLETGRVIKEGASQAES